MKTHPTQHHIDCFVNESKAQGMGREAIEAALKNRFGEESIEILDFQSIDRKMAAALAFLAAGVYDMEDWQLFRFVTELRKRTSIDFVWRLEMGGDTSSQRRASVKTGATELCNLLQIPVNAPPIFIELLFPESVTTGDVRAVYKPRD